MTSELDDRYLDEALALAAEGAGRVAPNPMVGAVVVRDGLAIGSGFHRQVGGPHAEIEALREAGAGARGATLYVTLEPCAHHGRTPPCADAVIEAGIVEVIACHRDPNPRVDGRGFDRLEAAGVEARWGGRGREATRLNWVFLVNMVHRRPAVTVKWAMSLDGRIATRSGDSQWISGPEGREWALGQREIHDAIVVGSGTVIADDPRLTRRLGTADGPIVRVVLDRRGRLTGSERLFDEPGPIVLFTESASMTVANDGDVTVRRLDSVTPTTVLHELWRLEVGSVLVEGGGEVLGAFVREGCFDRVAIDCGPRLIGGVAAPGPLGGEGIERLADGVEIEETTVETAGDDILIEGFRRGCLQDLYASVGVS